MDSTFMPGITTLQQANRKWLLAQNIKAAVDIPDGCRRFYMLNPREKSLQVCRSHGADHCAYEWGPQIDPRWNPKQIEAYISGYCNIALDSNV